MKVNSSNKYDKIQIKKSITKRIFKINLNRINKKYKIRIKIKKKLIKRIYKIRVSKRSMFQKIIKKIQTQNHRDKVNFRKTTDKIKGFNKKIIKENQQKTNKRKIISQTNRYLKKNLYGMEKL